MAIKKAKAASTKDAAPKEIFFSVKKGDKDIKYQVLGKSFIFKGKKYTAEETVKNAKHCAALIASGSPSIVKV